MKNIRKKNYVLELQKDALFKHNLLKKISNANYSKIINQINNIIDRGKSIYVCGNGGSSSTANHMICDFLKRVNNKKKNIKIYSLNSNIEILTAIGNDINFNDIFSFQVEKLCNPGDLIIFFSVSGNSKNLVKALNVAIKKKIIVISFTGSNGGYLSKKSLFNCTIESKNYAVVEDLHLSIMHNILDNIVGKKNLIKN